ncbi:hypothetical protein OIU84_004462 [Salix udensis]|uniref:Uncharacterized protein n=1 Tax=Salix udensis TaxID=889485 RepID=A0AAD6K274_9ROSI|nr:hypothetical protein OIU84_004462 [Salix udensis]
MRSSKGTSGLREATGESVSGTEREARGGERREGDVLGLGKRLLGCREQRSLQSTATFPESPSNFLKCPLTRESVELRLSQELPSDLSCSPDSSQAGISDLMLCTGCIGRWGHTSIFCGTLVVY